MVTELDLEALYDRESGRVHASLRRFGVAPADTEDALHEVFLVAHRRWASLRDAASAHAWLVGIARNVARHHHRSRARRRRAYAELAAVESSELDGREMFDRVAAARYLEGFLASLEAGPREAFVLVELEQLRGRELAEAIGVSEAAAWSRLRRARRAFERYFARFGEDATARAAFLARADPANDGLGPPAAARVRALLPALPVAAGRGSGSLAAGQLAKLWAAPLSQGLAGFAGTVAGVGAVALALSPAVQRPEPGPERSPLADRADPAAAPRHAASGDAAVGNAAMHLSPPPEPHLTSSRPRPAKAAGRPAAAAPVPVQRSRVLAQFAEERVAAERIEALVRAGRDEAAERASIEYFERFGSGRFEARVRALRVAVFCRQGKLSMAATERRLFLQAAPDEAERRAPWLACEDLDARQVRQAAERARLDAEFDEL